MKFDNLKDGLNKFSIAFSNNVYMKALSQGMMGTMSLMMISSVFTLIGAIDIGPTQVFMASTGILQICKLISTMTIDIISVYIAFLVAYKLGDIMKKDALNCGIMGLLAFFILCPLTLTVSESQAFAVSNFGSQGVFTALFGSLLAARLYIWAVDHKLTIKMPDSVPPFVANSFAAIIPGIFVAVLFAIIAYVMTLTPYGTVTAMLMKVIQTPFMHLGNNIFSAMIIVAFIELLWFFGMHGVVTMMPIIMMLWMEPQMANLSAYAAGETLPYLFTYGFVLGNRGARSLAVSLHCMFNCKSERLKATGKLGLVPALFGISEPIKFGIPQVMNIRMLLPLMLTPAVSVLSAYLLTIIGFLPYTNGVTLPTGFPVIISGFFTNGWQGIIAQLVQLVLCYIIYIPFMRREDKFACAEEALNEQEA